MELSLEGPEPAAQPIAKPRNLDGGGAVRGGAPGRAQERLLGDVRSVREGGGPVTEPERTIYLPPGYRLDMGELARRLRRR
jgi:hypothetical protein